MKSKFLSKMRNNPKYQILKAIKRSQGLSVADLVDIVGLSYMGVTQHCKKLEEEGLLDTGRRPKGMGRPEKAYRLTQEAEMFFPSEYGGFACEILESIQQIYGPSAPDKILFNIYKNWAGKLAARVTATSLEERAVQLASLRDEEGYMSEYSFNAQTQEHYITDYHCPILMCIDRFPLLRELERQMMERILGVKVQRKEERISGLYKCIFKLGEAATTQTNIFMRRSSASLP